MRNEVCYHQVRTHLCLLGQTLAFALAYMRGPCCCKCRQQSGHLFWNIISVIVFSAADRCCKLSCAECNILMPRVKTRFHFRWQRSAPKFFLEMHRKRWCLMFKCTNRKVKKRNLELHVSGGRKQEWMLGLRNDFWITNKTIEHCASLSSTNSTLATIIHKNNYPPHPLRT